MNHEFTVAGPIQVRATVRSSDLVVTAAEPGTATVRLESSRDAAERGAFAAGTVVELTGSVLHIETRLPRFFSRGATCIYVAVPPGSSLQVGTGSGDITCTAPLTRASVRTGSGNVSLAEAAEVEVTAGSGDVQVAWLGTGRITTGSGDVAVGTVGESLSTRTGSGDVTVDVASHLTATSGSGSVSVDRANGAVAARTASGDVNVWRAEAGELELRATSGNVSVAVVRGAAVLLDCTTISGRMRSSLESATEPLPDEQRLELRLGTVSGDIQISRA
ncbi:DUF4097 family beta strand repeat-containing protein [Georgenia sp. MJ170]|uniref:DUF4097 family beta strand repeat-containing protein n=1 Tax=Georgenia sunbinii TaxID=3117728 RepID=UPI002F26980C